MAFYENMEKSVAQQNNGLAQRVNDTAEVIELNNRILAEEKHMEQLFFQMGEYYFETYTDPADETLADYAAQVYEVQAAIDAYLEQVKQLRGIDRCPHCGGDVPSGSAFCNLCGAGMPLTDDEEDAAVADVPVAVVAAPEEALAEEEPVVEETPVVEEAEEEAVAPEIPAVVETPTANDDWDKTVAVSFAAPVPTATVYCSQCGTPIEEGCLFCTNCGTKVTVEEPAPMPEPEPAPAPIPEPAPAPVPAPAANVCPRCGTPTDGMAFCVECGLRLNAPAEPPVPPTVYCTICGETLEPDMRFCMNCGTPVAR